MSLPLQQDFPAPTHTCRMFYSIGLAELFHIFRLHSKSITPFILKANNGWDAKKATKGLF